LISRAVLFEEFAGREAELAHLIGLQAKSARSMSGAVVSICGEAGVGKSRLLSEFNLAVAKERGAFVRVRCEELPVPYAPIVAALHVLSGLPALRKVSVIGEAIVATTENTPEHTGDAQARRVATTGAVLKAFDDASRRIGQLTLAFDDLHWSDSTTLEILGSLARRVVELPMVLLLAYRPQEVAGNHARGALIAAIEREGADRIVLGPLAYRDMERLIRRRAPEASDPLIRRVYDLSEGRPYVAEELTRSVIEHGSAFDPAATLHLRSAILSRLTRLGEAERAIVDHAAVLGRNFRAEDLFALGFATSQVRSALLAGFDLQIFEEHEVAGRPWYRFRHALTREIVYREMFATERQAVHLAIANHLETNPGRITEFAYHVSAGGDERRSLAANERAGDHVMAMAAFSDAAHAYATALEVATEFDDEVRIGKKYIAALSDAADPERLMTAAPKLSNRLVNAGCVDEGLRILLDASRASRMFDFDLSGRLLGLAEPLISPRTPSELRYVFEICRVDFFLYYGRSVEALDALEGAQDVVSSMDRPTGAMRFALMRWRAYVTGTVEASDALCREVERRIQARDWDGADEALCLGIVAGRAYEVWDFHKAVEYAARAVAALKPGERLIAQIESLAYDGSRVGRFDIVRSVAERLEREGRKPSETFFPALALLTRACGGDVTELLDHVDRFIETGLLELADCGGGALAFIADGDRERARSIAVRVFEKMTPKFLHGGYIVHAVVEYGTDDEARRAIEMLPAEPDPRFHVAGHRANWELARARYAARMHRPIEAKQRAAEALALAVPTGSWLHIFMAHELAGDLASARAVLENVGATAELERFDRRHRVVPLVLGTSSAAAKLTRREEQIARAIASGATNREVAERLSIGVRTVEAHLVNVYAKLAVASRSELKDALEATPS
jgi:DNA-binding CsgD family transcriptional regulator